MQNIIDILTANGLKVTDEQKKAINKAVSDNYKTVAEHDKKVAAIELERDGYKKQYEAAEDTIKSFDGIDPDDVKKKMGDYEQKIKDLEESHKKELYDRDFADALKTEIGAYKFSSEYAKKSVMAEIQSAGLKLVDGKIIGLNDMIDNIKSKDASAFVNETEQAAKDKQARFSSSIKPGRDNKISMSELMKMKNENPGLDIAGYINNGKGDN